MANTYGNGYFHLIFAVNHRYALLTKQTGETLYRFLNTQINNSKQKLLAVNGYKDHIHLLISINPDISLSDFVQEVKISSSKFLKENSNLNNFSWQKGYGYFSYGKSQLPKVIKYIENQEEHHRFKSFREEYEGFLIKFDVPYSSRYVFEYYDVEKKGFRSSSVNG